MTYISNKAIKEILRNQEITLIEIKSFKMELFIIKSEIEELKKCR